METDLNKTYDDEDFVGRDVFGYPYNMKYPPDYFAASISSGYYPFKRLLSSIYDF